jgi:urease accessory protein
MTEGSDILGRKHRAALHKLTAWLSPLYPVGAFAYSHGLEAAVSAGDVVDMDTLRDWIEVIIRNGAGRNDAILMSAAWRSSSETELLDINELACALAASSERLLETTSQGAAFMRTTGSVWNTETTPLALPVAVGLETRRHEIPIEPALSLYLHAFAANLVSAGIRLIPLGQTEGQKVISALFPAFDEIAEETVASGLDDIGGCAFRSDLSSMTHETQYSRLFRS